VRPFASQLYLENHIPTRERIVLAFLMGLGLIATACGMAKLASVKTIMASNDPIWDGASLGIWGYGLYLKGTRLEMLIDFI
jgi:uncharacterized membrane protein YidH (DUF202 family)